MANIQENKKMNRNKHGVWGHTSSKGTCLLQKKILRGWQPKERLQKFLSWWDRN